LGTSNYLLNAKNTKPDLSAGAHATWEIEAGKKYLFRFANSASQSGWRVGIDNHTMTVIGMCCPSLDQISRSRLTVFAASDFVSIQPYETDFIDISLGQRYDVIVEANQAVGSYFLRAATQGACPSTCDNTAFGLANGIIKYSGASDALPTTSPSFTPGDVAGICQDELLSKLVPVVTVSAGSSSAFAAQASTIPAGQLSTVATANDGAVFRWYLNGNTMDINPGLPTLEQLAKSSNASLNANTTFSSAENVAIISQKNTWVYFVIQNEFFAPHPLHLHGHDFSVLGQGQGPFTPSLISSLNFDNPARRDTALLAGQGYTVVGFETDNPGAWLMHCHIAWHASGGLSMQFLERPSEIPAASYALSDSFQNQCHNYGAFADTAPFPLLGGDSGLKVRREELAGYSADVVRRSEKASKRYLSHNLRRGLGDSHHQHGHY
jgi:FtsP/CotA-like multicopper oxidase with cupredoxin domain